MGGTKPYAFALIQIEVQSYKLQKRAIQNPAAKFYNFSYKHYFLIIL
jgi:hypothetical protein